MSQKPDADDSAEQLRDADEEDVEGHSLPLVMGLGAMDRQRQRDRQQSKGRDDDIAPITKPFPRMKDEKRK